MTQEEKDLVIKDLCGRLPYGVKTPYIGFEMTIRGVDVESKTVDVIDWGKARFAAVRIEKIKPYLRPMSSMTEEEKYQYEKTQWEYQAEYCAPEYFDGLESYDWLNAHLFDFRGLIGKGLALEAPEGMYNN